MKMTLLDIDDLTIRYATGHATITALDSVSLEVGENEFLGVVGESGCGKSTLGLSIIGLLPPNSQVVQGSMNYKETNLVKLDQNAMKRYRGTEIAMIFQEPLTSLNPVYRVEDQIAEAVVLRKTRKESGEKVTGEVMQKVYRTKGIHIPSRLPSVRRRLPQDLRSEVIQWLNLVRIPDPEQVLDRYPFELSGGMRQRVMIAMALSQEPALLIADEPTTALDVTTQAQVLKLMRELMDKVNTSIILVTHDLAVASQVADRVVVMYAGEIAEDAEVHDFFSRPMHPYAKALLNCIPNGTKNDSSLSAIPGSVPDMMLLPHGCQFAPRCPHVTNKCNSNRPRLIADQKKHKVACFLYDNPGGDF
jgi:oligopeptide/dipeptide ABC transporter ATP-binding protein